MTLPLRLSDDRGQVVDFWGNDLLPEVPQRIGFQLSGGADSALLLFLTCHYLNLNGILSDVEIHPVTGSRFGWAPNTEIAQSIIECIRGIFPNANIHNTIAHTYNHPIGKKLDKVIKAPWGIISKTYGFNLYIAGTSLAPPSNTEGFEDEEVSSIRSIDNPSFYEDLKVFPEHGLMSYMPLRMVDKKWIAHMYHEFGLMETLYPLTVSCTTMTNEYVDKNGLVPCKKCFWCKEKYWAFGSYDGGIK